MDIKRIDNNNETVEKEKNVQIKRHNRNITVKDAEYIEIRKHCDNITVYDVEDVIIEKHCHNITVNNANNVLIRKHCYGITINNANNVEIKEHSGRRKKPIKINSDLNVLSLSDSIIADVQNVNTIYGNYSKNNITIDNINEVEDGFYHINNKISPR